MTPLALAPVLLLLAALSALSAEPPLPDAFAPVEQIRAQAEALEAPLLAPESYAAALAALQQARDAAGGGAVATILDESLDRAQAAFGAAARVAAQARERFAATLERREAARSVAAPRLAGETWRGAEELLGAAARRLEAADESGAIERAGKSAQLYDEAQLLAIKAELLTQARSLVVSLGSAGTARWAPKSTTRAQELLRKAEAELDADRSRTQAASGLAVEAAGEARRALAFTTLLREARKSGATTEELLLEWEGSLARAAAAAGAEVDFAAGPRDAAAALTAEVAALHERAERQADELRERDRQILALEEEIRELDGRLAGVTSEARAAAERLAAQARAREQLQRLEGLFSPEEALVLRQGDDLIVRVHGLGFSPGSARLEPGAAPLLERLAEALALYPSARVVVEGHTDSTGDSATNQRLSQQRAETVREQLIGKLPVPAGRLAAIGYGDSRPVAGNADEAGRSQNRRIDLVISPPPGALP